MNDTSAQDYEKKSEHFSSFLSSFAEIERQTYATLSLMPEDTLTKHASEIQIFAARVRFIQALLRSSGWALKDELSALFETSLSLAKFRNKIVHNPQSFSVYANADQTKIQIRGPNWLHAKTGKDLKITLGDLKRHAEQASQVAHQLMLVNFKVAEKLGITGQDTYKIN